MCCISKDVLRRQCVGYGCVDAASMAKHLPQHLLFGRTDKLTCCCCRRAADVLVRPLMCVSGALQARLAPRRAGVAPTAAAGPPPRAGAQRPAAPPPPPRPPPPPLQTAAVAAPRAAAAQCSTRRPSPLCPWPRVPRMPSRPRPPWGARRCSRQPPGRRPRRRAPPTGPWPRRRGRSRRQLLRRVAAGLRHLPLPLRRAPAGMPGARAQPALRGSVWLRPPTRRRPQLLLLPPRGRPRRHRLRPAEAARRTAMARGRRGASAPAWRRRRHPQAARPRGTTVGALAALGAPLAGCCGSGGLLLPAAAAADDAQQHTHPRGGCVGARCREGCAGLRVPGRLEVHSRHAGHEPKKRSRAGGGVGGGAGAGMCAALEGEGAQSVFSRVAAFLQGC